MLSKEDFTDTATPDIATPAATDPKFETLLVGRAYTWTDSPEQGRINFKIIVGPEADHTAFRDQIYDTYRDKADFVFCADYLFSYDVTRFLQREKL